MRRYLLFAGCSYYAAGGWLDFIHDFDSAADAIYTAARLLTDGWRGGAGDPDWYQVVDQRGDRDGPIKAGQIIAQAGSAQT